MSYEAQDAEIQRVENECVARAGADTRLATAIRGYLSVYYGPWGVKASSEDALLGIIHALYPGFPEGAGGIIALRDNADLVEIADWLWEDLECAGMDAYEIARAVLPRLDAILAR